MAETILDGLGLQDAEVSILLVSDAEIRKLNRKYLDRDRPTNVISFTMDGPARGGGLLGDVVISTQTAEREAKAAGMRTVERFARLLAHGILHLTGMDHERGGAEARRMTGSERRLVALMRKKGLLGRGGRA
jgi:probable rRNA maturation factor